MFDKTRLFFVAVLFGAVAMVGCASSNAQMEGDETGNEMAAASTEASDEFPVMTWAEVASAMQNGAVLVDARGADGYASGHIEGAVNGPSGDEDALKAALPENKDAQLVFYCGGPQCSASTKAAATAKAWGYTAVAEYKGGYPEWSSMTAENAPAPDAAPADEAPAAEEAAPAADEAPAN